MRSRQEILRLARDLADAVGASAEIAELQRCEAALGELRGADLADVPDDPRAVAYLQAKARAERLIQQVTSVFLFPLTGGVGYARGEDSCAACLR